MTPFDAVLKRTQDAYYLGRKGAIPSEGNSPWDRAAMTLGLYHRVRAVIAPSAVRGYEGLKHDKQVYKRRQDAVNAARDVRLRSFWQAKAAARRVGAQ